MQPPRCPSSNIYASVASLQNMRGQSQDAFNEHVLAGSARSLNSDVTLEMTSSIITADQTDVGGTTEDRYERPQ